MNPEQRISPAKRESVNPALNRPEVGHFVPISRNIMTYQASRMGGYMKYFPSPGKICFGPYIAHLLKVTCFRPLLHDMKWICSYHSEERGIQSFRISAEFMKMGARNGFLISFQTSSHPVSHDVSDLGLLQARPDV